MRSKVFAGIAYKGDPPNPGDALKIAEMFFCFVAGFSESFVPNILSKAADTKSTDGKATAEKAAAEKAAAAAKAEAEAKAAADKAAAAAKAEAEAKAAAAKAAGR